MNQEHGNTNELKKILEIAWRRKWIILLPLVLISFTATLYALYLPNLYRSSTSIFIEPQKVPTDYVRSTVTSDIRSQIRTITQQLTSRTKLLKVSQELNLYQSDGNNPTPNEVIITIMRNNLEIETKGRDQNFFQVHFTHRDPAKAMLGVSRLVSLFIEESLQVRENQAKGTTRFIEEELQSLKKVLEKQENIIQRFKRQHMGELPGQLDANLRVMESLQIQLTNNLTSQREIENRMMNLEQEITRIEAQLQVPPISEDDEEPVVNLTLTQLIAQRDARQQRVNRLETTYTSRHPDLINARKELQQAKDQLKAARKSIASQVESQISAPSSIPEPRATKELINLKRQLKERNFKMVELQRENDGLKERISKYQTRIESAPKREQELLSLTRDYQNTKLNYEQLLTKKLNAQLSENLEKRQQGEKFRILDPANLPEKPYLPNRIKIILLGIAGGLGLGIGIALLLETLFPVFNNLASLKDNLDLPIVIGIPLISSPEEKRKSRIMFLVKTGMTIVLVAGALFLLDKYVVDLTRITHRIQGNIRSMYL